MAEFLTTGSVDGKNEDRVGTSNFGENDFFWVIDGGSSVADINYLNKNVGDVEWFSEEISSILKEEISHQSDLRKIVSSCISRLREDYFSCIGGNSVVPRYAWPIAALSLLRVFPKSESVQIDLLELGDCITLIKEPGQVTYRFGGGWDTHAEEELQKRVSSIRSHHNLSDSDLKDRVLPFLRKRREEQHEMEQPVILGLNPAAGKSARLHQSSVPYGTQIAMMSDGFFRLVESYRLYSPDELIKELRTFGTENCMKALRNFENNASGSSELLKKGDDASVVFLSV
jgi:hypothetical protein